MIEQLRNYPGATGIVGTISGWASFDLLRTSQIAAAMLAALVSLCTVIIIAPKVITQLRAWLCRRG